MGINIEGKEEISFGYKDEDGNPTLPLPKQEEFQLFVGYCKHMLYASGLGCGKSESLCFEALCQSSQVKNNFGLMGRKVLDAFKKTTLIQLLDMAGSYVKRHNANDHVIEFVDGSMIIYLALDDTRDAIQRIKSLNLGFFSFDQLEEIPEATFESAAGQLRRKGSNRCSFHAANPAGHNWIWKKFKKTHKDNRDHKDGYGLVEAKTWPREVPPPKTKADVERYSDNKYLPPDYITWLLSRPQNFVNRFVHCGWEDFAGLIYPGFDEDVHCIDPIKLPLWWNRYIIYDYGYTNPTCIMFAAVDNEGTIYVYDLIYEEQVRIPELSKILHEKIRKEDANHYTYLADPSIMRTDRDGQTIAGEWEEYGVYWDLAKTDIRVGIERGNNYLSLNSDGRPKVYFFKVPQLRPGIDEFYDYHWKELRYGVEDRATPEEPVKVNDHFMDTYKYIVHYVEESFAPRSILDWNFDLDIFNKQSKGLTWMSK